MREGAQALTWPRCAAARPAVARVACARHATPGAAAAWRVLPAVPARAAPPSGCWAGGACTGAQRVGVDGGACRIQGRVAPGAFQRCARRKKQAGQTVLPGQTQRAVQQAVIGRVDHPALQPQAGHFNVLHEAPGLKRLARMRQAQRGDVPAHALGAGSQVEREVVFSLAGVVAQRLQRQPFQPCPRCQRQPGALQGLLAGRAVKTCGARCGDQGMRARPHGGIHFQRVVAHQAARRVHQHVVADAITLGVQALQNAQRAAVPETRHRALLFQGVVDVQMGVPGHG